MMVDYLEFQLQGAPDQRVLVDALRNVLPSVEWRQGNSDEQGRYVKGYDPAGADFAFWLDDGPATLTMDYRRTDPQHKAAIGSMEQVLRALLSRLGCQPLPTISD